ncbi:hypothetical protein [Marinilactibacillus psychrotolerans]|uniref:hypothetical protein n=1 Tax=Marinilactibacillus psychrotolerans TaxID=191770 RepID=UPI0039B12733
MTTIEQVKLSQEKEFKYIIEGKTVLITLSVDNNDAICNADGNIDCPLETVLRKNNFTLQELRKWELIDIRFVKIIDD